MRKGFTLIELLIVIVIIGILAGVVLTVINPAQQRDKANISVARANLDKVCLAMLACGSTTNTAGNCVGYDAIGAVAPTQPPAPTAVYTPPVANGTVLTAQVDIQTRGNTATCSYTCTHDISSGQSEPVTATPATAANCYGI